MNIIKTDEAYVAWIQELSQRYQQSQIKAAIQVNSELLQFYWRLGHDIIELHAEARWGSGFYKNLSEDLRRELPNAKGFSVRNLQYMKAFYELFPLNTQFAPQDVAQIEVAGEFLIFPQLARKSKTSDQKPNCPQAGNEIFLIPWGHIRTIIDKCKGDTTKALFYVRETLENNWSRNLLLNFLDTDLYERQGKAVTNFSFTLPEPQSDLAQQLTRDPYNFDFLAIRKNYDEKELKNALMDNLQTFLLELGRGFAYLGREYRLTVGGSEEFLDMLFYNVQLHCYVVVEVKARAFRPADTGQLGTYVIAVNHLLKGDNDNDTVGLIVCKEKNDVLARYSLESTSQPLGISEYELTNLLPDDFKGSMPTIEEIEAELGGIGAV